MIAATSRMSRVSSSFTCDLVDFSPSTMDDERLLPVFRSSLEAVAWRVLQSPLGAPCQWEVRQGPDVLVPLYPWQAPSRDAVEVARALMAEMLHILVDGLLLLGDAGGVRLHVVLSGTAYEVAGSDRLRFWMGFALAALPRGESGEDDDSDEPDASGGAAA